MLLKKRILTILLLIILGFIFSSTAQANTRWNLMEGYVHNLSEFKEFEIGKRIVYWHRRMIGEAIVEKDQIVYYFDRENKELVDVKMHWREDILPFLPELHITQQEAESMVEGIVEFSNLYIISPKSDVFPVKPTPRNPCWVVASTDEAKGAIRTIIDAVEGRLLGYGIAPPYTAFSLSGPQDDNPCDGVWTEWYENARDWFDTMGYSIEAVEWPTEAQVQSHIQSKTTAMFYEIAHSGGVSWRFRSGCDGGFYEETTADEIEDWINDYTKMPFTFLASCFSMCDTSDDTLSYEFRKGSTEDTATVGYCDMSEPQCDPGCWSDSLDWQDALLGYMNDGETVEEAFDLANADYPACFENECTRFAGDENFRVVNPIVTRVTPNNFIIRNSSGDPVAWFDNLGNLFLKGEQLEDPVDPIPAGSFIITDSEDVAVAYIDNQGNLWIDGSLSESSGSCDPEGDAFIVKNSSNTNVACIDFANGDLCLTGELYEY